MKNTGMCNEELVNQTHSTIEIKPSKRGQVDGLTSRSKACMRTPLYSYSQDIYTKGSDLYVRCDATYIKLNIQ